MRIGYPSKNFTVGLYGHGDMRIISGNKNRLEEIIERNLDLLDKILRFNLEHELLYYRLPMDLLPDVGNGRLPIDWENAFKTKLRQLGDFAQNTGMRISVHSDLYTFLTSPDPKVNQQSIHELEAYARVLELMGLDSQAKIQTHIGDKGKDKEASLSRFIEQCNKLDDGIKKRLAIENDCVVFTLQDCLRVHRETGIPIIFDILHHHVLKGQESLTEALALAQATWKPSDGRQMVDYSSQKPNKMPGKHADSIDIEHFKTFFEASKDFDFDLMIEIKDMEASALKAREIIKDDPRFVSSLQQAKQWMKMTE